MGNASGDVAHLGAFYWFIGGVMSCLIHMYPLLRGRDS